MKVYISGAISGVKDYEKEFSKAEEDLKAKGYETVNPCTLPHDHDKSYAAFMKEDIKELLKCDAIYMLDGWEDSRGASTEHSIAMVCGLRIYYSKDFTRDYDSLFEAGTAAQLEKLRENEHKTGWENLSLKEIWDIIYEEYNELEAELIAPEWDYKKIRREAADLANGCHFLILKCNKEM